jgi:hypothetical protein
MGHALNILREKVMQIEEYPQLILEEYFMINIFSTLFYLTPFKDYLEFMFTKRRMSVVARRSGSKVMHLQMARLEIFNPRNETNINTTTRVVELGTVAMVTLLREFHDSKKASHKYFSVSKSEFSWEYCPQHHKQATLGIMAVNDVAESVLGGCTRNVQIGNRIHLSSAAAISDAKRNHIFDRPIPSKRKTVDEVKSRGIFHQFHQELQRALLEVGIQGELESLRVRRWVINRESRWSNKF